MSEEENNIFNSEVLEAINKPLKVYQRKGSGSIKYDYYKGEDVLKRLNEAFKHCWSSEVISVIQEHNSIVVHASISVWAGSKIVTHHGFGSSEIAVSRSNNKVLNIGNSYKAANTDALKKAAECFGIGLVSKDTLNVPASSYSQKPKQPIPSSDTPRPPMGGGARPVMETTRPPMGNSRPTMPVSRPPMDSSSSTVNLPSDSTETQKRPPMRPSIDSQDTRVSTEVPEFKSENSSTENRTPMPPRRPAFSGNKVTSSMPMSPMDEETKYARLSTDAQKSSIEKVAKRKGVTVVDAIKKALGDKSPGVTLNNMTLLQGAAVIKYINTKIKGYNG